MNFKMNGYVWFRNSTLESGAVFLYSCILSSRAELLQSINMQRN